MNLFRRSLWLSLAGVACVVAAVILSFVAVSQGAELYYTVREGDTLSGIAQRKLGDAGAWPDLAAWNRLEVVYRDGLAIVWLDIGQVIQLVPEEPRPDPAAIHEYSGHTKVLMEREIFRMIGVRDPYLRWDGGFNIMLEVRTGEPGNVRRNLLLLRAVDKHLRHLERYAMVDAVYDWALADQRLNKFWPNDPYWVQHRKACLLVLAVLDIESNSLFVRGSHGELGPFQIKPKTYDLTMRTGSLHMSKYALPTEDLLMRDFEAGLFCCIEILQQQDEVHNAIAEYNKGSHKWVYANKVLSAFNKMYMKGE